jgi:hypothetical protein
MDNEQTDIITDCIEDIEFYTILVKIINAKAKKSKIAPRFYMAKLGFESNLYYTMRKFSKGRKLPNGMIRPLSEANLKKLCKNLGIELKVMFLINYPKELLERLE